MVFKKISIILSVLSLASNGITAIAADNTALVETLPASSGTSTTANTTAQPQAYTQFEALAQQAGAPPPPQPGTVLPPAAETPQTEVPAPPRTMTPPAAAPSDSFMQHAEATLHEIPPQSKEAEIIRAAENTPRNLPFKPNAKPNSTVVKQLTYIPPPSSSESLVIDAKPLTYNQSKDHMLKVAPKTPVPDQDSVDAFNIMMQQNMPLTPEQVVKLRQLLDATQRAAAIPATVPPKPVSSTIMLNLAPGSTPPAIRLAQGYVTSLVFVDATGTPWPIASYDLGNPAATRIQWDEKSNILIMQGVSPYSDGDIVIRLVGLPTPITLELVSGQRVVDYRTDIHVPGIGPNTKELPIGTPTAQ